MNKNLKRFASYFVNTTNNQNCFNFGFLATKTHDFSSILLTTHSHKRACVHFHTNLTKVTYKTSSKHFSFSLTAPAKCGCRCCGLHVFCRFTMCGTKAYFAVLVEFLS